MKPLLLQIDEYGIANHMEYLFRKYQRWKQHKELAWHQGETGMSIITSSIGRRVARRAWRIR
ncbi:MAG: hypothetical protein ACJA0W_003578 [Candidatus Azotimanducaceae bacterium]|jgi:hypothetical protein